MTIPLTDDQYPGHHFRPMQPGSFSLSLLQGSGAMLLELRKGLVIQQGTFNAVIAPEPVILSALNGNPGLGRFLFLFVCGNYSRLLSKINRTSSNFEIRRPFTADQLLNVVKEAGHTIIFIEHDPTLFDGADRLLVPLAFALRDAGHGALVILYSPSMDRPFAVLARQADRVIEILHEDGPVHRELRPAGRFHRQNDSLSWSQKTLEVF
jgi:hypothetical protein